MKYMLTILTVLLFSCATYEPQNNNIRYIKVQEDKPTQITQVEQQESKPIPCQDGEVELFGNICVRQCPAGMSWEHGQCKGRPYAQVYERVLNKCKEHHKDYRLIDTHEVVALMDSCQSTWTYNKHNFCAPYLSSPIKEVIKPINNYLGSWTGQLIVCDDSYGYIAKNCSWEVRFYTRSYINTEFNLLRASQQYGSAMSGGICVREL